MPSIETIYNHIVDILGGTNSNQFFTMMLPGILLNPADYAYDTTTSKPALVAEAESLLVDAMYDIAQVTGGPNGQHVSSQYLTALSSLVPLFDPLMPVMKNMLREFLASPAPPGAMVGGQPFAGDLEEYYFALHDAWLAQKAEWDAKVIAQRDALSAEAYLEWYEATAEGQLALIDAAEGRLLTVFSPSDMEAILGALNSGPGGDLQVAADQVLDLRLPSPNGGYIYPVSMTPDDWFLDLATDTDPVDLLADPAFIALTLSGRRQGIMSSISQVQALISQLPTSGQLQSAAQAYASAQTAYSAAQNALLNTYTSNTLTAVELCMAAASGGESEAALEGVEGIETLGQAVSKVSAANGDNPPQAAGSLTDGSPLSPKDLDTLVKGQQTLTSNQAALVTSAQGLASAGLNLAMMQSANYGGLPLLLARLQSQLADVTTLQSQLVAATSASVTRTAVTPPPQNVDSATATAAAKIVADAKAQQGTALAWFTQLYNDARTTPLNAVYTSSYAAWVASVADAVSNAGADLGSLTSTLVEAADAAAKPSDATAASVAAAVGTALTSSGASQQVQTAAGAITSAASTASKVANATSADVVAAVDLSAKAMTAAISTAIGAAETAVTTAGSGAFPGTAPADLGDPVGAAIAAALSSNSGLTTYFTDKTTGVTTHAVASPDAVMAAAQAAQAKAGVLQVAPASATAQPSRTSDRWMNLQYSFDVSDMASSSAHWGLSSQTSWQVDLFLGSASGSSSLNEAVSSASSLDTSTQVEIGLSATKVVVDRGWFNPGVFKLSPSMAHLTSDPVSLGAMDASKPLPHANDAILPCYPVAFVVVKDVTIKFQVQESQLSAVQSVIDSRSATGGGFLCFSASSSSATHYDSSSTHSHTSGTVITITMPGAQILGWFCEYTPQDSSVAMSDVPPQPNAPLNIIQFVERLQRWTSEPGAAPHLVAPAM